MTAPLKSSLRLPPSQLRRICDPGSFKFETTASLAPFEGLIGQDRALEALDLGARIDKPGFNLFVLGETGTARHGTVRTLIENYARTRPSSNDWIYVANPEQPDRPKSVQLPAGQAQPLKQALETAIKEISSILPAMFESREYQARQRAVIEAVDELQEKALEEISDKARERNMALLRSQTGFSFAPVEGTGVMPREKFDALPDDQKKVILDHLEQLQVFLAEFVEQVPSWERERRKRVAEIEREYAGLAIRNIMAEIEKKFSSIPTLQPFLVDYTRDLINSAGLFKLADPSKDEARPQVSAWTDEAADLPRRLRRFQINVFVGDGLKASAPVVVEDNPSLGNLVGRIEHQAQMGALLTDFTLIRPGSLHQANGGFLLIDARRLLLEPYAWEMLKRCLRSRSITIESPTDRMSIMSTQTLRPDPIPLSTKVVLFGDRSLYYALFEGDPDFPELFKIAVDFDDKVEWTDSTLSDYARLIGSIAQRENLKPLTAQAVALVIEELAREAQDAGKLSLKIGNLADHLREADFWAQERKSPIIDAADVDHAAKAWERRHDRLRLANQEHIERQIVLVDTLGAKIGQVNGLSVMSVGGYAFGKPSRITASVRIGRGEVIDIEREVALGGPLHSKGVLILSAYLSSKYALNHPPSLAASLAFEQSYGGVDGDSASSAELYALLSALSGIPIDQRIAVTGSVNQLGEVQAIGGVNEKIEGFFELCRSRGLDGNQAVMIPKANIQHLMLHRDVLKAAAANQFHIYAVSTIEEGIEILTGLKAGARQADRTFPASTINRLVEDRLIAFAEARWKLKSESGQS